MPQDEWWDAIQAYADVHARAAVLLNTPAEQATRPEPVGWFWRATLRGEVVNTGFAWGKKQPVMSDSVAPGVAFDYLALYAGPQRLYGVTQVAAALRELTVAVRSVNRSKYHKIKVDVDDQPCYWQRGEWIELILELCDQADAVVAEIKSADGADLVEVLREVRSDLFLQLEPKHGPQAASQYPSIVKADALLHAHSSTSTPTNS